MRSKKPMAKHVFDAHFVGSRISWSREKAQAKKGPCGPTKSVEMEQNSSPKRSLARGLKVGNQPLFILTKKQLETPTRESSIWGWTRDCPISFLPPSTWREQCPRAVISTEVWRMMELHHLPQDYTSSGRRAETKLSKSQQIDAINVKNVQDMIHVPSPWILKGKNWEHVVWMA